MSRVHGDVSSSFRDEDGKLVEYFRGDPVKDEHVEMLDGWGALVPVGEEHLTDQERTDRALNPDFATAQDAASAAPAPSPAGGTDERITGDYGSTTHTAAQLLAEIETRRTEGRTVEVTGSGSGGNVLRGDLETALAADDAAQTT